MNKNFLEAKAVLSDVNCKFMLCQNLSEVNRSCLLINRSRSAAAFEKVFTTNNHKLTVLKLVKKNLFENDGNICFNCLKTYYSLSSFSVFLLSLFIIVLVWDTQKQSKIFHKYCYKLPTRFYQGFKCGARPFFG